MDSGQTASNADRQIRRSAASVVELPPDSSRGDMVEVVAGADDLSVTDTQHEDAGHREGLSSVGDGSLIFELGDDDLGVGCLVDGDVGWPTVQPRTGVGWPEMLA